MFLWQGCCIRAKVVLIGEKWLYSGKSGCIRVKWLYSDKVVVFKQSGCSREKALVFGQSSSIRAKWLYSGKVDVFEQMWL